MLIIRYDRVFLSSFTVSFHILVRLIVLQLSFSKLFQLLTIVS